jgi:hypothetical protein
MSDYRVKFHQFPHFVLRRGNDLARAGFHTLTILAGVRICGGHLALLIGFRISGT